MIDALYRSLGSLRAWVTFIIGTVAATATWRSPRRANAAASLGAASSSLSHRKRTLPLLALLAAGALGLALLLPGGALQAQSNTIEYPENDKDPVATFTADDPEGSTSITWAVAPASTTPPSGFVAGDFADADYFEINKDGELTFAIGTDDDPPDFEAPRGTGEATATNTNTYKVVVTASDGTETGYQKVTVKVTDVDEPGEVTWTVDATGDGSADTPKLVQFQVGAILAASAEDGDIAGTTKAVTSPIWRWYRSPSATATGTEIDNANAASYTVGLDDVGMYLRVVAHYVVTGNVDQETASLTSDYPVLAARVGSHELEFDPATVSRSVAEGEKGANVGAPVTATDNHGAVNYVLGGTDVAKFKIDQKTGQITTDADLDYEASAGADDNCTAQNSCEVTVTATDASGESTGTPAAVTIKITNVDEKPTFPSAAVTAVTRVENDTALADSGAEATVTYTATDPETRKVSYALMGPDGARFNLSADQVLSFRAKPDYENPTDANRDNVYEVTVRASDGTLHADRTVKVTITSDDEAPEIMGRDSVSYAENRKDAVATFTAANPEGATSITWAVAAAGTTPPSGFVAGDFIDADHFDISKDGVLTFDIGGDTDSPDRSVSPDFEAPRGTGPIATGNTNTYKVVVAASDAATDGQTGYHKVTVKVTNVPESGEMSWTVDATGDGSADTPKLVQFQVGAILAASAEDGDIPGLTKDVASPGATNIIWRWYRGGALINGANTNSYTVDLADVGHRIRVVATYQVGDSTTQETAALTSDYPVMAARVASHALEFDPATVSRSVAEGEKGANVGAPVTATDNHGAVNYVLGGTDVAKFKIDQKTGQITTDADLDYEASAGADDNCTAQNSCEVTVTATDASGESTGTPAAVTIKITDVDEKPTFTSGAETVTVDEGVEIVRADSTGDGVFDSGDDANLYVATDPDGLNVNLSLMGPDAAKFSLDSIGVLSFGAKPDYEMRADANGDNVYEVTVRASDGTMTADRMVRVTVENVNEAPAITSGLAISGLRSVNYEENDTAAVGTYNLAGPDAATATWSLEGDDRGDFTLEGSARAACSSSPVHPTMSARGRGLGQRVHGDAQGG